jgi:hypothetical protein
MPGGRDSADAELYHASDAAFGYDGQVTMRAIICVSDLLFSERIAAAARASGLETRVAGSAGDAERMLSEGGVVAVVDVNAADFDAVAVIEQAKAAGLAVLAFGRHTDAAGLRRARAAGAYRVVARSQLVEELPDLLRDLAARAATETDARA